jgi:hypothetical protein
MTDATASLPPKFLPSQPPSGHAPGREDDSVRIAEDGPTFAEVLDMLNLLHHIPGISTIYRAITGDEIGAGPRFVGGMLFGGPIGALAAGITALFEEASGGDLGTHIAEMVDDFTGGSDPEAPAIAADTAAKAAAVVTAAGGGNAQIPQAALPAEHLAAQAHVFNRIALNPAAALGAPPPTMAFGAAQHIGQNTGRNAPPTAAETSAARLPKDAKIFPAHPERTAAPQGMAIPFGGTALGRSAGQRCRRPVTPPAGGSDACPMGRTADGTAERPRRREQESHVRRPRERQRRAKAGRAPMLPPRNVSPEWYAQQMNKVLNQYRAGANTLPAVCRRCR